MSFINSLLICLIEVAIYAFIEEKIFICKIQDKKKKCSVYLILPVLITIVNTFHITYVNLILVPVLYFSFSIIVYYGTLVFKLVVSILYYTLLVIPEFILQLVLNKSGISIAEFYGDSFRFIVCILFIKCITFFFALIVTCFSKGIRGIKDDSKKTYFLILPITTFVILCSIFYSEVHMNMAKVNTMFLIYGCIGFLLANAVMFYYVEKVTQVSIKAKELEIENLKSKMKEEHYKKIDLMNKRSLAVEHDFHNYLSVISSLARNNQTKEILSLLEEMENKTDIHCNFIYCKDSILNSLLDQKIKYAQKMNVSINVNVEPDVDLRAIKKLDLISVIGNLLDNSIEAAAKSRDERKVFINIFMANEKRFLYFNIENNYDGKINTSNGMLITRKKYSGSVVKTKI